MLTRFGWRKCQVRDFEFSINKSFLKKLYLGGRPFVWVSQTGLHDSQQVITQLLLDKHYTYGLMLGYFPARLEQRPSSKSQLFPFSCKQFLVKSSQIPPEGLVDHLKASHAEKNSTARQRVKSIGLCGTEISESLRWNSSTFYAAADILSAYISSKWSQRVRVGSLIVNPNILGFSYDNTRHCLKKKNKQ